MGTALNQPFDWPRIRGILGSEVYLQPQVVSLGGGDFVWVHYQPIFSQHGELTIEIPHITRIWAIRKCCQWFGETLSPPADLVTTHAGDVQEKQLGSKCQLGSPTTWVVFIASGNSWRVAQDPRLFIAYIKGILLDQYMLDVVFGNDPISPQHEMTRQSS